MKRKNDQIPQRISFILTFPLKMCGILKTRKATKTCLVSTIFFLIFSPGGLFMTRYYKVPSDPSSYRPDDPNSYTYVDGYGFTPPPPIRRIKNPSSTHTSTNGITKLKIL